MDYRLNQWLPTELFSDYLAGPETPVVLFFRDRCPDSQYQIPAWAIVIVGLLCHACDALSNQTDVGRGGIPVATLLQKVKKAGYVNKPVAKKNPI